MRKHIALLASVLDDQSGLARWVLSTTCPSTGIQVTYYEHKHLFAASRLLHAVKHCLLLLVQCITVHVAETDGDYVVMITEV
jgi:hypothetical protein